VAGTADEKGIAGESPFFTRQFVPQSRLAIFLTDVPLPTIFQFTYKTTYEMAENTSKQELKDEALSADLNTDENLAGTTHLNEAIGEESELEQLKDALEEEKKKYLYLLAEFDNYRRRTAKSGWN
jgi:hypothetical protein